jgi:hypothetical protein
MLLLGKDDERLFRTSPNLIANSSSAAEPKRASIILMVRPKPATRRIELRGDGMAPMALCAGGRESRPDRNEVGRDWSDLSRRRPMS